MILTGVEFTLLIVALVIVQIGVAILVGTAANTPDASDLDGFRNVRLVRRPYDWARDGEAS